MSFRLPTIDGTQPDNFSDTGENLQMYLCPINDDWIAERIGKEISHVDAGRTVRTRGQKFKNKSGEVMGGRYLYKNDTGEVVGALNFTKKSDADGVKFIVSNIYVRPDYRRQGIASFLVQLLRDEEYRVFVDSNMTKQGALFFGYYQAESKLNI